MEQVKLLIANSENVDIKNLSFLSDEEIDNLQKLLVESVRKEKAVSLYLKKRYIGEYSINEFGKPISKSTFFNISHSHGLVVLAISEFSPVGVDIELVREVKDDLKRFVSSDEEYRFIKDDSSFYEIWTSKESLVKAEGQGIRREVKSIPGLPINGFKNFLKKDYYVKTFSYERYIISITLEGKKDFQVVIEKVF